MSRRGVMMPECVAVSKYNSGQLRGRFLFLPDDAGMKCVCDARLVYIAVAVRPGVWHG